LNDAETIHLEVLLSKRSGYDHRIIYSPWDILLSEKSWGLKFRYIALSEGEKIVLSLDVTEANPFNTIAFHNASTSHIFKRPP